MWVTLTLFSLIIFLYPFYLQQKATRPLRRKELESLFKNITEKINAQYELHKRNTLIAQFDKTMNREANRGFEFPTSMLAADIAKLYINEISIFSRLLEEAIIDIISDVNILKDSQYWIKYIENSFSKQNIYVKKAYSQFIKDYYRNVEKERVYAVVDFFASSADVETELHLKKLISTFKLVEF